LQQVAYLAGQDDLEIAQHLWILWYELEFIMHDIQKVVLLMAFSFPVYTIDNLVVGESYFILQLNEVTKIEYKGQKDAYWHEIIYLDGNMRCTITGELLLNLINGYFEKVYPDEELGRLPEGWINPFRSYGGDESY
jgi:hypothetical protein